MTRNENVQAIMAKAAEMGLKSSTDSGLFPRPRSAALPRLKSLLCRRRNSTLPNRQRFWSWKPAFARFEQPALLWFAVPPPWL